ncbi:MAG: hypothetical protein V1925_04855 [Candidatus Omnitrophota bacterium]
MKKYIFSVILLLVTCSVVSASKVPDNCVCEITARVISAKEEPVKKDEFQKQDLTSVFLEIEITKVGSMLRKGDDPEMTCEQYKIGEKITLNTIKERDFIDKNIIIKPGIIIKGNIEYTGDERGTWYFLDKIGLANGQ